MKKQKEKLVIITGSSGSGKDSVIEGLQKQGLDFCWVITTTSREKRKNENEGKPYYFKSREEFEEMIKNDELLEHEEIYGNYYGSTVEEVEGCFSKNELTVFKIDPTGARTIKKKFPESFVIFITPPSLEILEKRLKNRGTEKPEEIKRRLDKVRKEMEISKEFDGVVANEEGKLDETVEKVLIMIRKYANMK
ncbi:MAG: guanylate kinase [Patescibacteria group bacterium]|nr:guanylate kinase [Patescibacteria group bacterium]